MKYYEYIPLSACGILYMESADSITINNDQMCFRGIHNLHSVTLCTIVLQVNYREMMKAVFFM